MQLYGVDFSSAPSRKKPIAVAAGHWQPEGLWITELEALFNFEQFESFLQRSEFIAAIDMPFGLSRELVEGLQWPGAGYPHANSWGDLIHFYGGLTKETIRQTFKAWCDARPAGKKFSFRACEKLAGSSPAMKWIQPPVAFMLWAGAPLLKASGVHIPSMQMGDVNRVAIEAYPGFLARQILGQQSYKTDAVKKDTSDRRQARMELISALEDGMLLGIRVQIRAWLKGRMIDDAQGDFLDAALCCLVAAWCEKRKDRQFGLPADLDPVEGWIAPVLEAKTKHSRV